jgi:HlyD family secretion protein
VRVAVLGGAERLRPGMTASVDIVTDARESALTVPLQSVTVRTLEQLRAAGGDASRFVAGHDNYVPIVYVVENGRAHARQVKTGIQSENAIEILEGVEEGEDVVSGNFRAISRDLTDGAVVSIARAGDSR